MAIGIGTALAIGAISSAAGGAAKGVIQSRAAGKAAKQQQAGAQEANRYLQQGLGQLGGLYSPYINSGAGAIGTLGRLTTPGPGARFASPGPPNAMPQQQQPPPGGTGMAMGRGMLPNMGGLQGPYMMAEGGDMIVDRPTMFIAGEAGPERATFSGGPGASGAPNDIRSKLLAKYGAGRGRDPRQAMQPRPPQPPQPPMPPQGAGGWGGTFAQMQGPRPQLPPMAGGGGMDPRIMANMGQQRAQGGGDPRILAAMEQQRAQGGGDPRAMPQDLPWIGGATPQGPGGPPPQWTPAPQGWNYY